MAAPGRWIRLDIAWEDSPWLDALSGEVAGCWPRLLCWVKRDGVGGRCKAPDYGVLARRWRVTRKVVAELVKAALEDGALSEEMGEWVVSNWDRFQKPDPTASARMARYRDTSPNGSLRRNGA